MAGGKSRRMGRDKAQLPVEQTVFLDRIAQELSGFDERILSVDVQDRYPELGWRHVTDRWTGCGPIGGLCSVLTACSQEQVLVVTCDLPLFRAQLGHWLCRQLEEPWDAVVPETADGIHPLCAVYRKRCAPVLEKQITSGDYRLRSALSRLKVRYVPASDLSPMLYNVNTPEEYQALLDQADHLRD